MVPGGHCTPQAPQSSAFWYVCTQAPEQQLPKLPLGSAQDRPALAGSLQSRLTQV
jgi:hypothetical protein